MEVPYVGFFASFEERVAWEKKRLKLFEQNTEEVFIDVRCTWR